MSTCIILFIIICGDYSRISLYAWNTKFRSSKLKSSNFTIIKFTERKKENTFVNHTLTKKNTIILHALKLKENEENIANHEIILCEYSLLAFPLAYIFLGTWNSTMRSFYNRKLLLEKNVFEKTQLYIILSTFQSRPLSETILFSKVDLLDFNFEQSNICLKNDEA